MELPFGGTFASDTFETGTVAAAHGGTTTIIDFAVQTAGGDVRDSLDTWYGKAEGNCAVDYAFHMIIGGVDDSSLKLMGDLVAEGITSFKLFMAYPGVFYSDDGQILRAMQRAAELGAMISMHAENGIAIDVLAAQAAARGETAPIHHGITRPARLEGEATFRAIQLALVAGAPVYFVHLSSSEALEQVSRARAEGHNVFAETCPQYLYLTLEDHLGAPGDDGFEGAKYVCSAPLRSKHENHGRDLWRGLRTNDLSIVATDHCPFCYKDQKELGREDFRAIPNGIGGVEHRMDLIYQGVVTRRAEPRALGGDVLDHPGADVRPVPAQGRHRPRRRRRHRALRPAGPDDDLRRDPPHEHGLLRLRGLRGGGRRPHRHVARHGRRGPGHVPRHQGARPVPAAGAQQLPALSCPPAGSAVVGLRRRRGPRT